MPNKPYLIKMLQENYIFTKLSKGLYFVESFRKENEQFS